MRIIAGKLKGLTFTAPRGTKTHPMSDKARGGLFNTLGDITGLGVLDAFSGSGALSYEAISRGASDVTAIESDNQAYRTIKANIIQLGLKDQVRVSQALVKGWLSNNPDRLYDLILVDPPYNDLNEPTIKKLANHLQADGTLALSWPGSKQPIELAGLDIVKIKDYGDAQLVFYKKIS